MISGKQNNVTMWAIEWVFGKSVVPAGGEILVFGRQGGNLSWIHTVEERPNVFQWMEKDYVGVDVQQWIQVVQ